MKNHYNTCLKIILVAIYWSYTAQAMYYSTSSSDDENDFYEMGSTLLKYSNGLLMNAFNLFSAREDEKPKDEIYFWLCKKKKELVNFDYEILQWRSPKTTWRPHHLSNKKLLSNLKDYYTRDIFVKKKLVILNYSAEDFPQDAKPYESVAPVIRNDVVNESFAKEAAKVACLLPQPRKFIKVGNEYVSPEDIESLLCRVINHLSEIVVFEGDLVSYRPELSPHRFHSALENIVKRKLPIPFLLSFIDEPSHIFPYDQFIIISSAKHPVGFKKDKYASMTFYQILLTSTAYPEARQEYHYWIAKKDKIIASNWIDAKGSTAKPDFLFIVGAKGDLQYRRYWTYDQRIDDETELPMSVIYDLYQRSTSRF